MKNISVTVVKSGKHFALQMLVPTEYKALLGEHIRPEGTFLKGLILHCRQLEAHGATYTVLDRATSPGARLSFTLDRKYAGVLLSGTKATIDLEAEATVVDNKHVIYISPTDISKAPERQQKVRFALPNSQLSQSRTEFPIDDLEKIRQAVITVRASRRPELLEAVSTLVKLCHRHAVVLQVIDGKLTASVRRDLFASEL